MLSHAEIVSIPQNLIAKIPDNVQVFEEAAFTTQGSIACRVSGRHDPKLGEYTCVIGWGLLGQITCQLLRAKRLQGFWIDHSENLVRLASELSADLAMNRNDENLITQPEILQTDRDLIRF
jgi:polar amino acid transport system substrate-binding protein